MCCAAEVQMWERMRPVEGGLARIVKRLLERTRCQQRTRALSAHTTGKTASFLLHIVFVTRHQTGKTTGEVGKKEELSPAYS